MLSDGIAVENCYNESERNGKYLCATLRRRAQSIMDELAGGDASTIALLPSSTLKYYRLHVDVEDKVK